MNVDIAFHIFIVGLIAAVVFTSLRLAKQQKGKSLLGLILSSCGVMAIGVIGGVLTGHDLFRILIMEDTAGMGRAYLGGAGIFLGVAIHAIVGKIYN